LAGKKLCAAEKRVTPRDHTKNIRQGGGCGSRHGGSAAASSRGYRGKLRVGVGTYSYHSLSLEDMMVQLTALGIQEIEMSRGEFMLMNTPGEDLFRSARAQLDRAGIRCVSYYSATIKDRRDIENATSFANLLGVRHITGDATRSVLAQIDPRFTEAGLTFGIHNHYFKGEKFPYESPEDVLKALSGLSKTVGATADVGHFASCGHDPVEAVRKLAPRLHLVHLKDVEAAGGEVNVLLGRASRGFPKSCRNSTGRISLVWWQLSTKKKVALKPT